MHLHRARVIMVTLLSSQSSLECRAVSFRSNVAFSSSATFHYLPPKPGGPPRPGKPGGPPKPGAGKPGGPPAGGKPAANCQYSSS